MLPEKEHSPGPLMLSSRRASAKILPPEKLKSYLFGVRLSNISAFSRYVPCTRLKSQNDISLCSDWWWKTWWATSVFWGSPLPPTPTEDIHFVVYSSALTLYFIPDLCSWYKCQNNVIMTKSEWTGYKFSDVSLAHVMGTWAFKNTVLYSAPNAWQCSKRWKVKSFSLSFQKFQFVFKLKVAFGSCLPKGSCLQTALSFSACLQPCLHRPQPSFSQPRQMGCNSPWISSTNPLNWQERLPLSGVKDSFLHRGWLCCLHRTTRTCQPAKQEASLGHPQIGASCLVRTQSFKEHVEDYMECTWIWHYFFVMSTIALGTQNESTTTIQCPSLSWWTVWTK